MGLRRRDIYRSLKLVYGRTTSALSPPPRRPWLMLPPENKFCGVTENKVVNLKKRWSLIDDGLEIKGSSHGWLCVFNSRNCDLFLSNPISGRHIKLPSLRSLPIPEESLEGGYGCVSKVILSGCPDEEGDECRAMMIFGSVDNRDWNRRLQNLAFCCPGGSQEWTCLDTSMIYEDFVYSSRHKWLFCLQHINYNHLEAWSLTGPASARLAWSDDDLFTRDYDYHSWYNHVLDTGKHPRVVRYLVFAEQSSSSQLYLVTRHVVEQMARHTNSVVKDLKRYNCPYKTIDFSVHKVKVDREGRRLVYMEGSIDGLTMFVGLNHSFAVSDPSKLKPNSIYFTDDNLVGSNEGHDIGIFDYRNRTISPCYYPCDIQSFKMIKPTPIWFTPIHP